LFLDSLIIPLQASELASADTYKSIHKSCNRYMFCSQKIYNAADLNIRDQGMINAFATALSSINTMIEA